MLTLIIPPREYTIETPEGEVLFKKTNGGTLLLEHSLISLSKWESKYKKPFLNSEEQKTREESLYYIKCMTLKPPSDENIYDILSDSDIMKVNEYIDDSMTATWFSEDKRTNRRRNREIITSELIYYWMVALNIPFEVQKWHVNRLITLIRICEIKQRDPKKMKKGEVLARNRELNAARRKRMGSKG